MIQIYRETSLIAVFFGFKSHFSSSSSFTLTFSFSLSLQFWFYFRFASMDAGITSAGTYIINNCYL